MGEIKIYLTPLWQYAIAQRKAGETDIDIILGLEAKGVPPGEAARMTAGIAAAVSALVTHYDRELNRGILLIGAGGFLCIVSYVLLSPVVSFLISIGPIAWGIVKCIKAPGEKKKYEGILEELDPTPYVNSSPGSPKRPEAYEN